MSLMGTLAEQLQGALGEDQGYGPPTDGGLIVKLRNLRHADYPGQGAHGILPVVVLGHEEMTEDGWRRWVREIGVSSYGPGYTERVLDNGVELKEMTPTAPFGRSMRDRRESSTIGRSYIDQAAYLLNVVEKWPSIYNTIAQEMAEQELTLREFMERVSTLPTPHEIGNGQLSTLGDLIGRGMMVLPTF